MEISPNLEHAYSKSVIIGNCDVSVSAVDSSWATVDSRKDAGLLRIGYPQLKRIKEEFSSNYSDHLPDVSISMLHHPLSWIFGDEQDEVKYTLCSRNHLSTDVMLCGHTHKSGLEMVSYDNRTMLTLYSGVGDAIDDVGERDRKHNYALYTFFCDDGFVEVRMRKNEHNGYLNDSILVDPKNPSRQDKLFFPIHSDVIYSQQYYRLPVVTGSFVPIFPSKSNLDIIVKISKSLVELRSNIEKRLYDLKREAIDTYVFDDLEDEIKDFNPAESEDDYDKLDDLTSRFEVYLFSNSCNDDDIDQDIQGIIKYAKEKLLGSFGGYLNSVLQYLVELFTELGINKNDIQVYFRRFNNGCFEPLYCLPVDGDCNMINWADSLLKYSKQMNIPLIYSWNKQSIEYVFPSEWDDMLIFVPDIEGNNMYSKKYKTQVPVLTFGIKVKGEINKSILPFLSLLGIKEIIETCLTQFLLSFPIEISTNRKKL
jgi:hypothetical protein